MKRILGGSLALALAVSLCWAEQAPVSGSFHKGPAVGGVQKQANGKLSIRGEKGYGTVDGGPFAGAAEFDFTKEEIDFNTGKGTMVARIRIKKKNGSVIVAVFKGVTEGVTPTTKMVPVSGTWKVVKAEGPDKGLRGEGTWTGQEDFQSGVTDGKFTGKLL